MPDTTIYPDVLFIFPPILWRPGESKYWREHAVNRWARERGWLPKDAKGHVEVTEGQKAEIWGGRLREGQDYLALKFV